MERIWIDQYRTPPSLIDKDLKVKEDNVQENIIRAGEIKKLTIENQSLKSKVRDLESKLSQCSISSESKDKTVQTVINKTEFDKEGSKNEKLVEVDAKILAKYNDLINSRNFTTPEAKEMIDWINTYLQAYRVIDPNFKINDLKYPEYYSKLGDAIHNFKVDLDLYIKYR